MAFPRLDSSQSSSFVVQENQDQVIIPLHQQPKEEPKEISLKEYVDIQDNKVVAFVINWIKTTFTKDLFEYLNKEFKPSILNEIKEKTKICS